MKERKYFACADNGRDYIDFEFYSEHRANSKANYEDAKKQYKREHGNTVNVLNTMLCD